LPQFEPVFTEPERLALAGFLAGYTGLTREAYALDLRQYASWCAQHQLRLFQARRADIECFARDLGARGRARATITPRLCTIAGFYSYADLRIMPTFGRSACSVGVSGSGLSA
jgi:integrase/recombinase XerD